MFLGCFCLCCGVCVCVYLVVGHEQRADGTVGLHGGCHGVVLPLCCEVALSVLPQEEEGLSPWLDFLFISLCQDGLKGF